MNLTAEILEEFKNYLILEEKSAATLDKYMRDARAFFAFSGDCKVTKELVMEYKRKLIDRGYAVQSINSMLASVHSLLNFCGAGDCRVKVMKIQRETYSVPEKELTRTDYFRLLEAAGEKPRLKMLLQTICGTGIRVSELRYFTVEAVRNSKVIVSCKNKNRVIWISGKLRKALLDFIRKENIRDGIIFRTKNGKPINRSNIWTEMKRLCKDAEVEASKVFPHNLRKLFARTFYKIEKDIAKLADILGHSSINTTRIYIMSTGMEHRQQLDKINTILLE